MRSIASEAVYRYRHHLGMMAMPPAAASQGQWGMPSREVTRGVPGVQ